MEETTTTGASELTLGDSAVGTGALASETVITIGFGICLVLAVFVLSGAIRDWLKRGR